MKNALSDIPLQNNNSKKTLPTLALPMLPTLPFQDKVLHQHLFWKFGNVQPSLIKGRICFMLFSSLMLFSIYGFITSKWLKICHMKYQNNKDMFYGFFVFFQLISIELIVFIVEVRWVEYLIQILFRSKFLLIKLKESIK